MDEEDFDLDAILSDVESDQVQVQQHGDIKSAENVTSKRDKSKNETVTNSLEAELRSMQEKMASLEKELAESKKRGNRESSIQSLNSNHLDPNCKRPKLKDVNLFDAKHETPTETPTQKSRLQDMTVQLFGELDSSDEEAERNPLGNRGLNDCGKFIKQRLAHSQTRDNFVQSDSWKKPNTIKPVTPKISSTQKTGMQKKENVEKEFYSGIRIINPLIPSGVMKDRMEGRRMIRMSSIQNIVRGGEIDGDWVTIGVIVAKTDPKTSAKGKSFSIWRLCDLHDCSKIVSFFLFGNVHQHHWKTCVGSVVGILNPANMDQRDSSSKYGNELSFRIDHPDKLMLLGTSKDFCTCRGRRKDGAKCTMIVNSAVCEYCPFHIQAAYKRTSNKRHDLQASYSGPEPKGLQKKLLQKQQIFYGGQTYTSEPPKALKKNGITFASMKLQREAKALESGFADGIRDKTESDIIKNVTMQSQYLGEMLSVPSVGSKNLMQHLMNGEKVPSAVKSITVTELRKLQRKDQSKKPAISASPCQKPPSNLSSHGFKPEIGSGFHAGQMIDLDINYSSCKQTLTPSDLAKLRAAEKIRSKRIEIVKADPNAVKRKVTAESRDKIEKQLKRKNSDGELEDSEKCPVESKRSRSSVDSKRFQQILNQKSMFADSLTEEELERREEYFNKMESKEKLETKLNETFSIQCKVVSCKKCDYTALSAADVCKLENHPLVFHKATKRFFQCKNCKQRTFSLNKLPTKSCSNCGGNSYERTGMKKERKGPTLDNERLSLRGNEEKFLNSYSTKDANINL